jgi:hypothetical protein
MCVKKRPTQCCRSSKGHRICRDNGWRRVQAGRGRRRPRSTGSATGINPGALLQAEPIRTRRFESKKPLSRAKAGRPGLVAFSNFTACLNGAAGRRRRCNAPASRPSGGGANVPTFTFSAWAGVVHVCVKLHKWTDPPRARRTVCFPVWLSAQRTRACRLCHRSFRELRGPFLE